MNYQEMSKEQLIAELEKRDNITKKRDDLLEKTGSPIAKPSPFKRKMDELVGKINAEPYQKDKDSQDFEHYEKEEKDPDWERETD